MSLFDIGLNITKATSSYRFKLIIQAFDRWLKKDVYVLDIGCGRCGNGIITNLLKNSFSVRIVGCDIKNYLVFDIPFRKLSGQQLFRTKNLKFQFVKLQRPFWYPFSHIAFELKRV